MMQDEAKVREIITLNRAEDILYIETTGLLYSKLKLVNGRLVITNQRLIFLEQKPNLFGLIGVLLKLGKLFISLEVPVSEIKGWVRTDFGRNKNVIDMDLGRDKPVRFVLNRKFEEVDPDLRKALGR